jgi:hypothetical protein
MSTETVRPLSKIAAEIRRTWPKVNYAAEPYLAAMATLSSVQDQYYEDSGESIVLYFLSNATTWRGPDAKRIKEELKARPWSTGGQPRGETERIR